MVQCWIKPAICCVFENGIAAVELTAALMTQTDDGNITLSVARGDVQDRVQVQLIAEQLDRLTLTAPPSANQQRTGEPLIFAVTVTATGIQGGRFNPTGLSVRIDGENLQQDSFALEFVDGMAITTVTVNLLRQGFDSTARLTVESGSLVDRAVVTIGAVESLGAFMIVAADLSRQRRTGDSIDIAVRVRAVGTKNTRFNVPGLFLQVLPTGNIQADQSSYPLTFVDGLAVTTVTRKSGHRGCQCHGHPVCQQRGCHRHPARAGDRSTRKSGRGDHRRTDRGLAGSRQFHSGIWCRRDGNRYAGQCF